MQTLKYKDVKTKKPHTCEGCGRRFDSGMNMTYTFVVDGRDVNSYYLCQTCTGIVNKMYSEDFFCFGDLREEAEEIEKS